jgi:hypothetical protein
MEFTGFKGRFTVRLPTFQGHPGKATAAGMKRSTLAIKVRNLRSSDCDKTPK